MQVLSKCQGVAQSNFKGAGGRAGLGWFHAAENRAIVAISFILGAGGKETWKSEVISIPKSMHLSGGK